MPNTPHIHWTQDAELLEQFVMQRVDAERRKELEAHLLTCDECQLAVREQQQIILGIKRVGRDEMKARLKQRLSAGVAEPRVRRVPWLRIASIAAMFIVVFGLGLYNKWIPLGTEEPEGLTERQVQEQVEGADKIEEEKPTMERPDAGSGAAQPAPTDESSKVTSLSRRETPATQELAKRADGDKDLQLTPSAPSVAGAMEKKYDAQAEELADKAEADAFAVSAHMWVDGVVIANRSADEMMRQVEPSEQRLRAASVTVAELPLEELPASQKMKQQGLNRNIVQTLIEQQGDNLNFTLYRSGTQAKKGQQNAQVQQVSPDSIVIVLDGEQIGYTVKGGLDALREATKKKK